MPQENITTKYKLDISDLKNGINEANRVLKENKSALNAVQSEMDKNGKSVDSMQKKYDLLKNSLDAQKSKLEAYSKQLQTAQKYEQESATKVDNLRKELERAKSVYGANSTEVAKYEKELSNAEKEHGTLRTQVSNLTVAMNNQQATVNNTENELNGLNGTLKEVEKAERLAEKSGRSVEEELADLQNKAEESSEGFTVLKGALANLVSDGIELALSGIKKMGDAFVGMVKDSIESYAQYEQLVGGVETLFGAGGQTIEDYAKSVGKSVDEVKGEYDTLMRSQTTVFNNAKKAYKTAGLSANEYMEQATSFSASLIQGLGGDTEKAAKVADQAIIDMSDNANKMGTSMELIQNAYNGFAKGNFAMLDNLKLGYGGTKTEMVRLMNDSGVLKEKIDSLDDVTFDQMIEAIHVVQTNLGITGTTAKEASTTIEGSANSMKASWQNLLTGFADENADLDALIGEFIDSVGTYAENLLPRIGQVLSSIATIVAEHLPEIGAKVSEWIGTLVDGIIESLPPDIQSVVNAIKDGLATALDTVKGVIDGVVDGFKNLNQWMSEHKVAVELLATAFGVLTTAMGAYAIAQAIAKAGGIAELASLTATAIGVGALTVAETVGTAVTTAFGTALAFLTSPVTLVVGAIALLVAGIVLLIKHWDDVKEVASNVWEKIKEIWGVVADWFSEKVIEPVKTFFSNMWDAITGFFTSAWEGIKSVWNTVANWFSTNVIEPIKTFFTPIVEFFKGIFTTVWDNIKIIWDNIVIIFSWAWEQLVEIFTPVVEWFAEKWQAVKDAITTAWNAITEFLSGVWEGIKNIFSAVGTWFSDVFTTAWKGVSNAWSKAKSFFSDIWSGITKTFSNVGSWFKDKFNDAWTKIKDVFKPVGTFFGGIWDKIKEKFTNIGQKVGEAIGGVFKKAINAVLETAENILNAPIRAINKLIEKVKAIPGLGNLSTLNEFDLPRLERGGVLKRGQVGLLEGNGAEAVVPLERNKAWIKAVADDMRKSLVDSDVNGIMGAGMNSKVNNFTQIINAPKSPSRLEIYRQTKNLLALKGV